MQRIVLDGKKKFITSREKLENMACANVILSILFLAIVILAIFILKVNQAYVGMCSDSVILNNNFWLTFDGKSTTNDPSMNQLIADIKKYLAITSSSSSTSKEDGNLLIKSDQTVYFRRGYEDAEKLTGYNILDNNIRMEEKYFLTGSFSEELDKYRKSGLSAVLQKPITPIKGRELWIWGSRLEYPPFIPVFITFLLFSTTSAFFWLRGIIADYSFADADSYECYSIYVSRHWWCNPYDYQYKIPIVLLAPHVFLLLALVYAPSYIYRNSQGKFEIYRARLATYWENRDPVVRKRREYIALVRKEIESLKTAPVQTEEVMVELNRAQRVLGLLESGMNVNDLSSLFESSDEELANDIALEARMKITHLETLLDIQGTSSPESNRV